MELCLEGAKPPSPQQQLHNPEVRLYGVGHEHPKGILRVWEQGDAKKTRENKGKVRAMPREGGIPHHLKQTLPLLVKALPHSGSPPGKAI